MNTNTFFNLLQQSKPMLYMLFLSYFEPVVIFLCLIRFSWSWGWGQVEERPEWAPPRCTPWPKPVLTSQPCEEATLFLNLWDEPTLTKASGVNKVRVFFFVFVFVFFSEKFLSPFLLHLISDENPAFSDPRAGSSLGFYNGLCCVIFWVRNISVVCSAPTLPISVILCKGKLRW